MSRYRSFQAGSSDRSWPLPSVLVAATADLDKSEGATVAIAVMIGMMTLEVMTTR